MQQLLTRILEPARLQDLLQNLLEACDDADDERASYADRTLNSTINSLERQLQPGVHKITS